MMADDESYLYVNEGGFTPGMYERVRDRRKGSRPAAKRSAWSWLTGSDRGRDPEREGTPEQPAAEW